MVESVRTLAEVAAQVPHDRGPLAERRQGQLQEQAIESRDAGLTALDFFDVTADDRGRRQLDQRLEQVIGVVVPGSPVLGVERPAVQLRQGQRQPNNVFSPIIHRIRLRRALQNL